MVAVIPGIMYRDVIEPRNVSTLDLAPVDNGEEELIKGLAF